MITPVRVRLRFVFMIGVILGAGCLSHSATPATAPAAGNPSQVPAESITEVALERRCFGCDREARITVGRNGAATKTMFGNRRSGTTDRVSVAVVTPAAFDDLARVVIAEGFFQLLDEYRDPTLLDGESVVTTVTTKDRQKSVLDRNGRGPAALKRIHARIDAFNGGLMWKDSALD